MLKKIIYNRRQIFLCLLFMVLSNFWQGAAIAEDVSATIARKIDKFEIVNQPMAKAVESLRHVHRVRICLEEVEYTRNDANMTTTDGYRGLVINKKKISVNLTDATVEEILNNLTLQDKDYFWEVSLSGIINILPRSTTANKYAKSILNWNIPKLIIADERLISLGGTKHSFGRTLLEHGIA